MTIIIFRSIEEIHPLRLEMKEKVFSIFFPRHDQKSKEPYFQFRAPRQQQPSSNDFRRLSMRHSTMIEAQPGTLIILFFFVSSFWQMMLLECYRRSTYTRTWIKEERGRVEVPWEVSHRYRVELEGIFLSPQIFSWPAVLSRKTEIHFSGSRMLFFFQANLFSWSHTYLFIILFTFFAALVTRYYWDLKSWGDTCYHLTTTSITFEPDGNRIRHRAPCFAVVLSLLIIPWNRIETCRLPVSLSWFYDAHFYKNIYIIYLRFAAARRRSRVSAAAKRMAFDASWFILHWRRFLADWPSIISIATTALLFFSIYTSLYTFSLLI